MPGSEWVKRHLLAAVLVLLVGCSSKLENEYDFRPYLVSWASQNCGKNKTYQCDIASGFAEDGFDGEDYVYGLYHNRNGEKRVVFVKIAAAKPHAATVVADEPVKD